MMTAAGAVLAGFVPLIIIIVVVVVIAAAAAAAAAVVSAVVAVVSAAVVVQLPARGLPRLAPVPDGDVEGGARLPLGPALCRRPPHPARAGPGRRTRAQPACEVRRGAGG